MARVKRGKTANKRRKHLLKYAKGFKWGRKSKYAAAKQAMMKAWTYSYRDRKVKKREFRKLWQIRISAALKKYKLSYSNFIHLLKQKNIGLDRKIMAKLANERPEIFEKIIEEAKK